MDGLPHGRPCWAEIDLDALEHNVRLLAARAQPAKLYAVMKANAYGHGAIACARAALDAGASAIAVVCVDEAQELRAAGIDAPILVVGEADPSEAARIVALALTPTLTSRAMADELSRAAVAAGSTTRVHVELESGLNRNGLRVDALVQLAEHARDLPGIEVDGLYTHLAAAEEGDAPYTRAQFDLLAEASRRLPWIPERHISASASLLLAPAMKLDAVRAGIALYGYHPAPEQDDGADLRPVLSLKARVMRVIDVEPGATVGYGRTWTAQRPSRIALIMCGYADGLPRSLSNRASVLIGGHRAPIAGRIAMDMCMADVTGTNGTDRVGVAVGDEAVIIGTQGDQTIDAEDLAQLAGTISWEILAGISARVPRWYLRGGRPVARTTLNEHTPVPVDGTPAATR